MTAVRALSAGLAALLMPGTAAAQAVGGCEDWRASAWVLAEPWEDNSATFANGDVRIAIVDTIEPAAGAFHLLVLSPPFDEVGGRQCRIVSGADGAMGLSGLTLEGMAADYDPGLGLILTLAATRWDPSDDSHSPALLTVAINQSTGDVLAELSP